MSNTKKIVSAILISSLLPLGSMLATGIARATTPLKTPILLSQAPPWRQTYVCGDFAITLSEQGRDRYAYQATNAKGQTLTIGNGTHHAGRNYSSIFTFSGNDGSQYVLEDYGGGKADLSIGSYPDKGRTYNCTTDGKP